MPILASLNQHLNLQRFWRGEGPQQAPITLQHRRVYILPTRQGIYFAMLLFTMLLGAMNYSNSLGYLLTFLLASLAITAILHSYRNLLQLQISLAYIKPTFCGDEVVIPVILDNREQSSRYAIELYFPNTEPKVCDVPANTKYPVNLTHKPRHRGWQPVQRFVIASRFPMGLFRSWSHLQLVSKYLVYPRPCSHYQLPEETLYKARIKGDQGHGTDDFAGLRIYRPGDSLHHIHWKALAREQGLLTKQFGGDRSEELWLDWRNLTETDTEQRLSILTYWVLEAEHRGLVYGLWLPGGDLKPNRGSHHQQQCLKSLALFGITDANA